MFLDIYLLMFFNLFLEGLAKLDHLFLNLKNMSVRIVNLLNEVNQSWSMKRRGHQSRKQRGYTLTGRGKYVWGTIYCQDEKDIHVNICRSKGFVVYQLYKPCIEVA